MPRLGPGISESIRICVHDASRMGTQLLADVLRRDRRFRVVDLPCKAEDLAAAEIQVAILFCNPGRPDDFEFVTRVRALRPEIKFVALMDDPPRPAVLQAFRAGVRGIFCRSDSYKTLAKCVTKVHAGHVWASQSQIGVLVEALGRPFPMTLRDAKGELLLAPREQDVVQWVAEGLTNREIADRMHLSEHTVKNYLFRIFDKLGVSTRAELVLYALSHALLPPEPPLNQSDSSSAQTPKFGCDFEFCPFAQLGLVHEQEHRQSGDDQSSIDSQYVRLLIAHIVSTTLLDQSSAALLEVERLMPASRVAELKLGIEQKVRRAIKKRLKAEAAFPAITEHAA